MKPIHLPGESPMKCRHLPYIVRSCGLVTPVDRQALDDLKQRITSHIGADVDVVDRPPQRFTSVETFEQALPRDCSSTPGELSPTLALRCQERLGAEIAFDWVLDRRSGRRIPFVTRGACGVTGSDQLLYLRLHDDYQVSTGWHTHPSVENHLGRHMPSVADFFALAGETSNVPGGLPTGWVYFPDGVFTRYALARGMVGVVQIGLGGPSSVDLASAATTSSNLAALDCLRAPNVSRPAGG
jgi:hypothetical protein